MRDIAESIQKEIDNSGKEMPSYEWWGDTPEYYPDYSEEVLKEMQKGVDLIKRAYVYAHRIDWLISGDDGEEEFIKRLNEELKELE